MFSTPMDRVQRYITEANRVPELDRETEMELARRFKSNGDRAAADRLCRAQLRYVVAIALKYRRYGIPLGELIAEGNYGLVHALGKYEPERGIRFITYAAYWVRAHVLGHVLKSWSLVGNATGPLRSRLFFKLRRERIRVTNLLGEGEAAEQVLAERLGVTPAALRVLLQRLDARDVSLDVKLFDDGTQRLIDTLPASDDLEAELFSQQIEGQVKGAVDTALAELDPRERFIAESRLMADPAEELTLAQIGRELGVSRERARQLEARTKTKLRARISNLGGATVRDLFDRGGELTAAAPAA
jgi:RNA polymerase sigma-32 factor